MANSVKSCPDCSGALGKGIIFEPRGLKICQECYDNLGLCTVCEDTIYLEDCETFNDDFYCETCFAENSFNCENCGEVGRSHDCYADDYGQCYCEFCY